MMVKLYDYWRSSACYRLRIAFNIKGVPFETVSINLHPDHGEQGNPAYRALNPQMRVPALDVNGDVTGQSMAILEWIEETWPEPRLLPPDLALRLKARAFAQTIACDIHPLNNLAVLGCLKQMFAADDAAVSDWYADWIVRGFAALESVYGNHRSPFLFGDTPTLAEVCLVPQIYNARRFGVDLAAFPELLAVDALCMGLPAFQKASPEAVKPVETVEQH